jgi:bifunctional UDP-N-acetylglucosamine pyrophosphorylase/glucosamine-1-phosphate N-acetyltransferase
MNCVKRIKLTVRIGVILAGGLGKRMNSHLPKPAHKIGDCSMLQHVINKMDRINIEKIYIVFGQKGDLLKESVAANDKIIWVHQDPQLGTGHALQVAFQKIKEDFSSGEILVCNGDAPFIQIETMSKMFGITNCALLACFVNNPHGYGRILKTSNNQFSSIIEEKDATDEQRKIKYINAGLYCFTFESLHQHLHTLENNNAQSEYYLTDLPQKVGSVKIVEIDDEEEIYNVNSREQLEYAETIMHKFI